jgi:hypothetical protein
LNAESRGGRPRARNPCSARHGGDHGANAGWRGGRMRRASGTGHVRRHNGVARVYADLATSVNTRVSNGYL